MNDAARLRARSLLRRHRRATIGLGLLVGLAGAIPMVGWEVARRTDSAFTEFIERTGVPDARVFACPAGYAPPDSETADAAAMEEFYASCMRNMSSDMVAPLLALDAVDAVVPATFIVAGLDAGGSRPIPVGINVGLDPDDPTPHGSGLVLAGRSLDNSAPGELVFDEFAWETRRPAGIEVGDQVSLTPFLASQGECAAGIGEACDAEGTPLTLTVVGVERMPTDLAVNQADAGGLYLSAGFWETQADPNVFTYGVASNVWFADDVSFAEFEEAVAGIEGRFTFVDRAMPSQLDSLPDAIAFQAGATRMFAALAAFAGLVFAGQALARQARREGADQQLLTAIGMTRREFAASAARRAVPIAAIGSAVAVGGAVLGSLLGPIGIARDTIAGPSIAVDPLVLIVGAILTAASAIGCATLPTLRAPVTARPSKGAARIRLGASRLPASVLAGLRAALPRRGDSTFPVVLGVAGSAVAIAAVIAAATLTASLDRVTADPRNFGVAWDLLVGNNGSPEDEAAAFELISGVGGIDRASGVMSSVVEAGEIESVLVAMVPVPGFDPIAPVILEGREPIRPHEVALGTSTLRDLGVEIGDEIEVTLVELPGPPLSLTVVGTVVLNDGFDAETGEGFLVDGAWARSQTPGSSAQAIAVELDPTSSEATTAELNELFGEFVVMPEPPSRVRHLVRVDDLPVILALVVSALAVASLAHAMWVAVRQRRNEVGILKTLGFSRGQVWTSIVVQAAAVAGLAFMVGAPVGLIGGTWSWRLIADAAGIAVDPVIVWASIAVCAVGSLALALAAAAIPGRRAARSRPAQALRAE